MPLYKIENPFTKATNTMSQAGGTFGRMQAGSKTVTEGPGKTAGSGLMAGMGGAMAGTSLATSMGAGAGWSFGAGYGALEGASVGGVYGAAIGAMVGIGAYLLS